MISSTNHDTLAFLDFISPGGVVLSIDLYRYVSIFKLIFCVFFLFLIALVLLFPLEVVPEGWVLQIGLDLELLVRKIEKEYTEKVVSEADDGCIESKVSHSGQ